MLLDWIPRSWDEVQAIATVMAIAVGGFWTWLLFVKGRQRWPQARCLHLFYSRLLPNDELLLNAKIGIENVGSRLIVIERIVARVQRIFPGTDLVRNQIESFRNDSVEMRIRWPQVKKQEVRFPRNGLMEIEPGEIDWVEMDFLLPADLTTFRFYSFVDNRGKKKRHFWSRGKPLGWPQSTIVNTIDGESGPSQTTEGGDMFINQTRKDYQHRDLEPEEQRQHVIEEDPPEEQPLQEQTVEEPDPPSEGSEETK